VIRNCVLKDNFAVEGGGAIFGDKADLLLEGCTFYGNAAAPDRGVGGGLMLQEIHAVLADCLFSENRAAWGGAMHSSSTRYLEAINCVMTANTALSGGGVFYSEGGLVSAQNCTAVGNVATEGSFLMDVTAPVRGKPAPWIEVDSCILADVGNEISNSAAVLTIKYTDIVAGRSAVSDPHRTVVWGPDNIEADPLFAEPGYWADLYDPNLVVEPNDPNAVWIGGDYHLQSRAGRYDPSSEDWVQDEASSPCIDAGNPVHSVESEIAPNGIRVNMGAYGGTVQAGKSDYSWQFVTTRGPLPAEGLGVILPHEHIFTDLRGPTTPGYAQADPADVVRVMSPYLAEALGKGVGLLFECSSIGVGRNIPIMTQVTEASGLPVVVPTGVYGRANFAPPEHRNMTEDELAALFANETTEGIEGTGIKAGFIKIATDSGAMTPLMERVLRAAGRAAVETGAAVASHTPTGSNAIRQVEILRSISPAIRFIWVHAQNESNRNVHRQVAALGGYIEFDNLGWNPGQDSTHIAAIRELLDAGHGDRILLSHDAGWYRPGVSNGGTQKPYTYLVDTFVPKLGSAGVDDTTIRMITETNPIRAFGFKSGQ
jgi:phosphotriesterase-related protein